MGFSLVYVRGSTIKTKLFIYCTWKQKNRSISRVFTQSGEDSGRLPPTGASFKPAVRSACNSYLTFLDMNSVLTKRKRIKYKIGEDHKCCAALRKKTQDDHIRSYKKIATASWQAPLLGKKKTTKNWPGSDIANNQNRSKLINYTGVYKCFPFLHWHSQKD